MAIRNLEEKDFGPLSQLILEVYKEERLALWFEHMPTASELAALFKAKINGVKKSTYIDLVSVENGRLVGECEIVRRGEKEGILGIIVKKEERGRGIGRELAKRAIEKAGREGVSKIVAEVAEENSGALAFFRRLGFKEDGEREEGIVADGVEHRVLLLSLSLQQKNGERPS